MKPVNLYHGSQYKLTSLLPRKAEDLTEIGSQLGIYAAETIDEVIRFAMPIRWYPDDPTGKKSWSFLSESRLVIELGTIDPYGVGYIYRVSSENFNKIDDWQWLATSEVLVVDVTEIKVVDYWYLILFSEVALQANQLLYPSETLYTNKLFKKENYHE